MITIINEGSSSTILNEGLSSAMVSDKKLSFLGKKLYATLLNVVLR